MTSQTVLVTGASSGIGLEIARLMARQGYDLIVLARRKPLLDALAQELRASCQVKVEVLEADLAVPGAAQSVVDALQGRGLQVDVLVNNAGFGLLGDHAALESQRQFEIVQVNIMALVQLTRLLLPGMIARDRGGVLNVASTAAFQAGPGMAVYYATKAFVLSYTEALHEELGHTRLHVSCLCPGPTDTPFVDVAGMKGVKFFKLGPQSAAKVARFGVRAFQANRAVAISGFKNALAAFLVRFAPRLALRKVIRALTRV